MKFRILVFLIFLNSCESIFYDNYKIIDLSKQRKNDSLSYTIKKGDNLYSISRKFNVSIQKSIFIYKLQCLLFEKKKNSLMDVE